LAGKLVISAILSATPFPVTWAQTAPELGSAGSFAVLGGTTVTCTSSSVDGDAGVSSGAVGGCTVSGTVHDGDPVAQQAYADFLDAYETFASKPCEQILTGTLAGATLTPGVYCFSAAAALTGVLTLSGPSEGIWIFKIGTSGTGSLAATDFNVVRVGGLGCFNDVYWWTAQAATLTTTLFFGTVLAGSDLTVTTGASVEGRALAKGAVTLTGAAVSLDFCQVDEVSSSDAVFPARLTEDPGSPTGFYLDFERLDAVDGYNLYEGTIGAWYSHGAAAGNVCDLAPPDLTDLGTGEMRAIVATSDGDHYVLVTAYSGGREGPSGFASYHKEISPALSTCDP
jgi:hypothetical protein